MTMRMDFMMLIHTIIFSILIGYSFGEDVDAEAAVEVKSKF